MYNETILMRIHSSPVGCVCKETVSASEENSEQCRESKTLLWPSVCRMEDDSETLRLPILKKIGSLIEKPNPVVSLLPKPP